MTIFCSFVCAVLFLEITPIPTAPANSPAPIYCRTPDTFSHTPLVQHVPSFRAYYDAKSNPCGMKELPSLEVAAKASGQEVRKFDFNQPANIPIPVFGMHGESDYEEGALIYEGMRLVVAQDGSYEVRFNLNTPAMPTGLRLQLTVLDQQGRCILLTLPPIQAGFNSDFQRVFWRQQWLVYHAGYSSALAEAYCAGLSSVTRSGTARFGSRPIEINPGSRLDYRSRPLPPSLE